MTFTRRILPVGTALAFVLAACGGSDSDESTDTTAATDAAPATTDEVFTETSDAPVDTAPAETEPAATEPAGTEPAATPPATEPDAPATDPPATDGDIGVPAAAIEASLVEWAIEAPTEYAAGDVTFVATNNGNFPHEFVVIQGESYESLPLEAGGAVIEDELPTGALLGRTERIGGGSTAELTVTLAPGSYVLVCNLGGGDNSHAGRGQRLDITVS